MSESTVDLPEWVTELVMECETAHNFALLVETLRGYGDHRISQLNKSQLGHLYKLAEPALVRKAQILWWWARGGRTEAARQLSQLIWAAQHYAKIDLEPVMQSTPKLEMDMVKYMSRVHELKRAYIKAQEGGWKHDEEVLAANLLSSAPVEAWEYDGDEAEVLKFARRSKLDTMLGYINRCRSGDTSCAKYVLQAVKALGYRWDELGTSKAEIKEWMRRAIITGIKQQLSPLAALSESMLFANIYGPLKRMLQYGNGISLKELDITKEELTQAKQRLERWIEQGLHELPRGREYQYHRREYHEFQRTVFPLFDQVLNQD